MLLPGQIAEAIARYATVDYAAASFAQYASCSSACGCG